MDLATDNRPETCSSLGLECGACINRCAANTAIVCPNLEPAGVHRVFFELYPSPGCQPMAYAFLRAYDAALTPSKPIAVAARAGAAAAAA
jgi:hypothetical protein